MMRPNSSFSRSCLLFMLCVQSQQISSVGGFQALPLPLQRKSDPPSIAAHRLSLLRMNNSNGSGGGFGGDSNKSKQQPSQQKKASASGDFAYQEMRANLEAMKKQNVPSRALEPNKRMELEGYVRTVLNNRSDRSIPLANIGKEILPQSKWRLAFSTAGAVLGDLPSDATVYLNILDGENLDYRLQFSKKTMGLRSITAKSKYTFDVSLKFILYIMN